MQIFCFSQVVSKSSHNELLGFPQCISKGESGGLVRSFQNHHGEFPEDDGIACPQQSSGRKGRVAKFRSGSPGLATSDFRRMSGFQRCMQQASE